MRYHYNQRNQLDQIQDSGGAPWMNFTYDAAGNVTKRQDVYLGVNDSLNVPSQYCDGLNRPTRWENTGSGDNVFARSWQQYDTVGRMTATWRYEENNKGERFGYNVRGQLTSVAYHADQVSTGTPLNALHNTTYTVDALNRQGVNYDGINWGFQANSLNQYTGVGGLPVSYDDGNFNVTAFNGATFSYNAQSKLISASKNGQTVSFTYDGLGRCVKRVFTSSTASTTTVTTYDGWKPLIDWDASGNLVAANIYGPGADEILTRWVSTLGTHLRYHHDVRGNVTFILNDNGEVLEKYSYDAFGKSTVTSLDSNTHTWKPDSDRSSFENRFMFQGREWISELGIYDYRNRMYHPDLGRFLQKDPLGFGGRDANLFRFCGGDPVNRTDPMGLFGSFGLRNFGMMAGGIAFMGLGVEGMEVAVAGEVGVADGVASKHLTF